MHVVKRLGLVTSNKHIATSNKGIATSDVLVTWYKRLHAFLFDREFRHGSGCEQSFLDTLYRLGEGMWILREDEGQYFQTVWFRLFLS